MRSSTEESQSHILTCSHLTQTINTKKWLLKRCRQEECWSSSSGQVNFLLKFDHNEIIRVYIYLCTQARTSDAVKVEKEERISNGFFLTFGQEEERKKKRSDQTTFKRLRVNERNKKRISLENRQNIVTVINCYCVCAC